MNKELETILERRQIKPTAMRLLVLEFLLSQTAAVSLPDLEEEFQYADRTTLYRTLRTFEEKLLVHAINDGSGSVKYALCQDDCLCLQDDLHLHFYCKICRETICLPKVRMPQTKLPGQFKLEELSLIARGVCDRCASKECN